MSKKILIFSLLANGFLILAFFFLIQKLGGFRYVLFKAKHRGVAGVYEHKKNMYELLPIGPKDIVFVGNSITEQCDWAELLGRSDVRNRGIAGDVTAGLLDRLDPILEGRPRQLFLMIGINDLISHGPEYILSNYQKIVDRIRATSPNTQLLLQSILPVNNDVRPSGISNQTIRQLNTAIAQIASDAGLAYVDLHGQMVDKEGRLKAQFTRDGIHINGEAYLIWKNSVLPLIESPLAPETEPENDI